MEENKETITRENLLRNQLIISLRMLQIISIFIILSLITIYFFPITIYGLGIAIIILMLYIRDLEKKIQKKIKEEEAKI